MKKVIPIFFVCIFLFPPFAWGVQFEKNDPSGKPEGVVNGSAQDLFRNNIPAAADRFVGIPYKFGGNPQVSGTSDNSYLFFSIYSLAAQQAGLTYHGYLPMKYLLEHTRKINWDDVKNGDLMVLKDNHAAMVFQVENTGRFHLIYASKKREQVISFNSDNLVFQVYWMENLKGFYRLTDTMLRPAR